VKIASILCAVSATVIYTGCALTETSTDDVGDQFQEGIQGRGQIVPNDPTNDAFGNEYN
jgi:hypothetical protein